MSLRTEYTRSLALSVLITIAFALLMLFFVEWIIYSDNVVLNKKTNSIWISWLTVILGLAFPVLACLMMAFWEETSDLGEELQEANNP